MFEAGTCTQPTKNLLALSSYLVSCLVYTTPEVLSTPKALLPKHVLPIVHSEITKSQSRQLRCPKRSLHNRNVAKYGAVGWFEGQVIHVHSHILMEADGPAQRVQGVPSLHHQLVPLPSQEPRLNKPLVSDRE
jgi:hypothetical protein